MLHVKEDGGIRKVIIVQNELCNVFFWKSFVHLGSSGMNKQKSHHFPKFQTLSGLIVKASYADILSFILGSYIICTTYDACGSRVQKRFVSKHHLKFAR